MTLFYQAEAQETKFQKFTDQEKLFSRKSNLGALIGQIFLFNFVFFGFVVWFLLTELYAIKAKKVLFTLNTYNLQTHDRR